MAILLTGHPGVGKTTAIKQIVAQLIQPAGGFYTEEIRESGARNGFKIVTLDGKVGVLAHVKIHSRNHVGRYGVDISVVDSLAVDSIQRAMTANHVVIIDEIGPMELFSSAFFQTVMEALQSSTTVVGTVVKRRHPVADQIKGLRGIDLVELTIENRDRIAAMVLSKIGEKQP